MKMTKPTKKYLLISVHSDIDDTDTLQNMIDEGIDELTAYDSPEAAMNDMEYSEYPDQYALLEISKISLFRHPKESKRTWVDINDQ